MNEQDIRNIVANAEEAILAQFGGDAVDWAVLHDILHSEMLVLLDNLLPDWEEEEL